MKRCRMRIGMCLILGLVTTYTVAWGLAFSYEMGTSRPVFWSGSAWANADYDFRRWDRVQITKQNDQMIRRDTRFGGARTVWKTYRSLPNARWNVRRVEEQVFGWPLPALGRTQDIGVTWKGGVGTEVESWQGALSVDVKAIRRWPVQVHRLPLRPHWWAVTIDAPAHGLIWFLLLFVPGVRLYGPTSCRKMIWRMRGRCHECGYDLRGSVEPGCPECGWNRNDDPPPGGAGG